MSLAQDFINAWDHRDRAEFERLLAKLPPQINEKPPKPATEARRPGCCGGGDCGNAGCTQT